MTARFFLVRHAAHEMIDDVLVGRSPGARLGAFGRDQSLRLAARLRREHIDIVQSSPRERARETAGIIAGACMLPVEEAAELDEVDFGSWSGQSFAKLDDDPRWRHWNACRGQARAPNGESMLEVEGRVQHCFEALQRRVPDGAAVLVTHAEIIRTAVCYCLGLSLDAWSRLEIAPASITTIACGPWGARLLSLNEVVC